MLECSPFLLQKKKSHREGWLKTDPSIRLERVYNVRMKRLNFFLPEQVIEALQALSEKTGLTVSEHIRRAIDAYLKKNK